MKNGSFIELSDFFYLVWLFADSTEPPTFESVIDPLEKARVPLYYSLYTGRQLGSGKAGRYFDAYKKVYSTRPRTVTVTCQYELLFL